MSRSGKVEAVSQMPGLWPELIPIVSGLLKNPCSFLELVCHFTDTVYIVYRFQFSSCSGIQISFS